MDVVVVGAGVAGLGTALHLATAARELLALPHVTAAAIDAFERRDSFPPLEPAGPTREELLAAMAVTI